MTQHNEALTLYDPMTDLVSVRCNPGNYIDKMPLSQVSRSLAPMVGGACIIRGTKLTAEAQALTAEALADQIKLTYPTITLQEIGKAIKQGSFGVYGEVYGVNAASLFAMVRGYMESQEKEELTKAVIEARSRKMQTQSAKNAEWLAQHPDYKRTTL